MGGFQPWHILVVAVVGAFLFFGWKNLPDMARSAGRSMRVFKTEIKGMSEDDKAREAAREARDAEPRQLPATPQQRPTPQAEVVRKPLAGQDVAARAAEPARSRPRPTPSPNGRPR